MTGEFTNYCNLYYELTLLLSAQEEYLKDLLDNAPVPYGRTRLSEIDAIISYGDVAQAAKAKVDKTIGDIKETQRTILMIMQHFEIPPGTVLTGEIPSGLAYEIWADEDDAIHLRQTKAIAPEPDNPNIMVIKLSGF